MEKSVWITKINDISHIDVIITVHSGFEHNKIILLNKIDPCIDPSPITSLNNKSSK